MKRRRKGSGTIDTTPGGRYRPRLPDEKRTPLGVYDTYAEAEAILDAAIVEMNEAKVDVDGAGVTLKDYGTKWLERRERDGVADIGTDKSRWRTHIEPSELADVPVRMINAGMIIDWVASVADRRIQYEHQHSRNGRKPARSTVKNTLNLLRVCLEDAVTRKVITENPARNVHVPRRRRGKKVETDDIRCLTPEQIEALLEAAPGPERWIIAFAIGTGLRQGEQWNLELTDVHAGEDEANHHVVVRWGSKGELPKNGKVREVPLFGVALRAARAWLAALPKYARRNPDALMFPGPRGGRRAGKAPKGWAGWLTAAKVEQPFTWHDLRHTCGSALVSGWWGRTWTLEETKEMLGHASVTTTEKYYARFCNSVLQQAARATPGKPTIGPREASGRLGRSDASRRNSKGSHLRDLNSRPTVYEGVAVANEAAGLRYDEPTGGLVARARVFLEAVAAGSEHAIALGTELANAVLDVAGQDAVAAAEVAS